MKIIKGLVCSFFLAGCGRTYVKTSAIDKAFQRPKVIKVAILPVYDSSTNQYGDISCNLAPGFMTGGWKVIDRSIIDKVMEEQKFQMTGAVENSAVKIGKLSGANFVATGVFNDGLTTFLSIQVIDVQTGEIAATATCLGQKELGKCATKEIVRLVNQK